MSQLSLTRWRNRQRLRWQTWRTCSRQYAAPIDPFRVIDLPPGAIRDTVSPATRRDIEQATPAHVQAVIGGGWDRRANTASILESEPYQWVATHVVGRSPPSRSDCAFDSIPTSTPPSTPTPTAAALECYLADLAATGSRAITERRATRSHPVTEPALVDPFPHLPAAKGEIRVNIGRDGRFLLHSGHARLAVARILDLESVPVHVYVRHEQWQARRDRIVLTGADGGDHPDLCPLEPRV